MKLNWPNKNSFLTPSIRAEQMTPILRERDHQAKSKDAIKKKWWLKKIHRWNPWWTTRDTTVPKTTLKHLSKLVYFVMFSSTFYSFCFWQHDRSIDARWSWHGSPHHNYLVLQSAWRFRWILVWQTFTSPYFSECGKARGICGLALLFLYFLISGGRFENVILFIF